MQVIPQVVSTTTASPRAVEVYFRAGIQDLYKIFFFVLSTSTQLNHDGGIAQPRLVASFPFDVAHLSTNISDVKSHWRHLLAKKRLFHLFSEQNKTHFEKR